MIIKMQSTTINPNLTSPVTFNYKDFLIKKLVRAVGCSLTSQLIILLIYIIFANIDVVQPTEWISSILNTFTRLSTWLFVIIFSSIMFAQCLTCAKDYVLMTSYCSTRFQQFLHIFSIHNFLLLMLHIIIGGAFVWQILTVAESNMRNLTITCDDNRTCLVQDSFFLILSGFWIGFYFFLRVYVSSKHLTFPVIQQKKFLQFRADVPILFKESLTLSLWPTMYFSLFYYVWGNQLEGQFISMFDLYSTSSATSILIYVYCWWYGVLFIFSMNLMRFFFHLFLTEPIQFPIVKENIYVFTLHEAILMDNLPIVQNLACLDLFLLSQWSPLRRQMFFSLSQPGGHPHNWNSLMESILKLFCDYTDLLKKSSESTLSQGRKFPHNDSIHPFTSIGLKSPSESELRYRNLRNMSLQRGYLEMVNVSQEVPAIGGEMVESVKKMINENVEKAVKFLKILFGINFLFGELPQVNIQKCLGNGQLIIWASHGISELAATSLKEDKYGIVQKDLPVIITTLVQLKQSLDKLNKVPALSKKVATLNDFNYKMKNAVTAAVKHSLFNLCLHFGDYLNDFPLNKDVLQYLQVNVMLKH